MVEVEHLKADNARLLALLKSTKEFKNFSDLADASHGRIHFSQSESNLESVKNPKNWMPNEALSVAN